MKEINKLGNGKAIQNTEIAVKILKQNADIFGSYVCYFLYVCVDKGTFSSVLKHANITPVFKKGHRGSKENYRPVSILPVLSKIFEKLLCKQITPFMDQFLSKYHCRFRKGFHAQHCLIAMLEKWKKAVDSKKVFGALLTDLSKAFDCLPHDLIIAKLNAYGFSLPVLNLIQNCSANRKQRTKINDSFRGIYSLDFPKAPSCDRSCLICFYVISFFLLKMSISRAMLMITHVMTNVAL